MSGFHASPRHWRKTCVGAGTGCGARPPLPAHTRSSCFYLSSGLPLAFSCSGRQRWCHTSTFGPPAVSSGSWFESKPLAFGFQSALYSWQEASQGLGPWPGVTTWEMEAPPLDPAIGSTCKSAHLWSFTHWHIEARTPSSPAPFHFGCSRLRLSAHVGMGGVGQVRETAYKAPSILFSLLIQA